MSSYYLIPKKLVKRLPFLRRIAWRLEALCFQLMVWFIQLFKQEQASRMLAWLFSLVGPHTAKAVKVKRNLKFVIPKMDEEQQRRAVKDVFSNLGRAATELIFMDRLWRERDKYLEFSIDPAAEAFLKEGRPTVFIIAHVGAWQLTPLAGAYYEFPLASVYSRETNPYMADVFYRMRMGFQSKLVPSVGGIRSLLRELREGNSVGMAVDNRLDGGEMVPFFGVDAPTNTVAARLALAMDCPLVPSRAVRLANGRFHISILEPIAAAPEAHSRDEKALDMTRQLNELFEQWIREDPTQWMCLKRRWPKGATLPEAAEPRH